MAHLRTRKLVNLIAKELKFWPVVALLGPRQCGKSTLIRDVFSKKVDCTYETLDQIARRNTANNSPELFLNQQDDSILLAIDEAHKAPPLFDEIKARVDRKRIPGRYLLTGSVQFSSKVGIKESLTGRAATVRMDAMTLAETQPKVYNLKTAMMYLEHGGMPGVCFLHDHQKIKSYWTQWIETTCERDLTVFSKGKFSSDLAYQIIEQTAKLDHPDQANISKVLRIDGRKIKSHLEALTQLFVVVPVHPSPLGVGKDIFLPFDCGLAQYFGASMQRRWQIAFLNQHLNKLRFAGDSTIAKIKYYLTTRGSFIDFVDEQNFYLFSDLPNPDRPALMTARAALEKDPKKSVKIFCATDSKAMKIDKNLHSLPWIDLFHD